MNEVEKRLYEFIINSREVKREKELEKIIDKNPLILSMFDELKEIQKQMVNSKYLNMISSYESYKNKYDELKENILDEPFVEEYLELLEDINNNIKNIASLIEDEISKDLI